jgi:hypothetical protein
VRTLPFFLGLAVLSLAAGCGYVPTRVSERFQPAPAQERVIPNERARVYVAVQQTLERMRFTLARTAEAQGVVLGRSQIVRNEAFDEKLQYEIEINVREFGAGETKIYVWAREQIEGGLTTEGVSIKPLRTHGLYDTFFTTLEQVLREPAAP